MPRRGDSPREPQQERAIETRRRLLDATLHALVDVGHAGTTTQEVCRRAHVSRGTLLHHFESRARLLTAALEDVIERRMRDFRRDAAKVPPVGDRVGQIVELLWARFRTPVFSAWLELVVAARTDKELRADVRRMMKRLNAEVQVIFAELFRPSATVLERFVGDPSVVPSFALGLLYGLALTRVFQTDDELQPLIQILQSLGTAAGVGGAPGAPGAAAALT